MRRFLSTCLIILSAWLCHGQNRYMVFFTDKDNTPYSTAAPLEFLSQRSLDRRDKNGFGVTAEDLPVDPSYVAELESTGAEVYFTSRWMNAALVQMEESLITTVKGLNSVDSVLWIANGASLSSTKIPVEIASDFIEPAATTLSTDTQNEMLEVNLAHQAGYTGEGIFIAVFDGGFESANEVSPFEHLHANGQIVGVANFVTNSGNPYQDGTEKDHGMKVLSTMAGLFEPNFTGVAPDANYFLLVTEEVETEYPVEEWNWLLAAEYADSAGVDVINSSLSYGILFDDIEDYPREDFDGETTATAIAANYAAERGIFVVTSAGNDGPNINVLSPADSPNVLTVGAVNENESKAAFSSIGPTADGRIKPDVMAMGVDAVIVGKSADLGENDGTSFASPIMAGLSALVIQAYPTLTVSELLQVFRNAGHQADAPDNQLGYGIPTFSRIETEIVKLTLGQPDELGVLVYPTIFDRELTLRGDFSHFTNYQLLDLRGQVVLQGELDQDLNQLPIEIPLFLRRGVYVMSLQGPNQTRLFRVIKR